MQKNSEHVTHNYVTDKIDIRKLEKETYNLFFLGLLLSICFHASLFVYFPHRKTLQTEFTSIPFELIVRRPRFTKPYLITKKTSPGTFRFRKKTTSGKPSKSIRTKSPSLDESPGELFSKPANPARIILDILPFSLLFQEIDIRMPKDVIPLKFDGIVDTGTYTSMVIIPSDNKMAIQGYTHIGIGCGTNLSPPETLVYAVKNLTDALNFYTNIHAVCDWRIYLHKPPGDEGIQSSSKLMKYPLIYISYDKSFSLTQEEIKNLAEYIRSGGFVIIDNPLPEQGNGGVGSSLKDMVIGALGLFSMTAYSDFTPLGAVTKYKVADYIPVKNFKPIPDNHEIFHCFFDFDDGPPEGYRSNANSQNYIEGIYLGDQLVGLYVSGYGLSWNDKRNEEHLKMGVNMVVYALRQGKGHYDDKIGQMIRLDNGTIKTW